MLCEVAERRNGGNKMSYKVKFVAKVTINVDVDANDPNIRPQKEIEKSLNDGEIFEVMKEIISSELCEDGTVEVEPLVSEWRIED